MGGWPICLPAVDTTGVRRRDDLELGVKPTSCADAARCGADRLAWSAYLVIREIYNSLPPVPRCAPVSVFLIGLIELQTSFAVRARLDGRPGTKPILPLVVARFAALAKASSLAGAVIGGAWAGLGDPTRCRRSARSGSPDTTP